MTSQSERIHGLEWLRGLAAVLVVTLHAGMAYTLSPFPGLPWPTHDPQPSAVVDALTWWIDTFIMPVFFILAGFHAAQSMLKRGANEFLKNRARRLLAPLLFGCVVILPLTFYILLCGWIIDGKIPARQLRYPNFNPVGLPSLAGIAHLWFLEYLLVFCTSAWVLQHVRNLKLNPGTPRGMQRLGSFNGHSGRRLRPLLLPLISAFALWQQPQLVIGFRHTWHPLPANVLYYLPCFAAGWWMHRQHRLGVKIARHSGWKIAGSLCCFCLVLPLIRAHVQMELAGVARVQMVVLFTTAAWLAAIGLFGLCLNLAGSPPRSITFLSAASLWMYVVHVPVVGLAHIALIDSRLPAGLKFGLVAVLGVTLPLLTYRVFVQGRSLDAILVGRWRKYSTLGEAHGVLPFAD